MRIHLIRTPEFSVDDFKAVGELLSSFKGPMKFSVSNYDFEREDFYFLQYELFPKHPFQYTSNDNFVRFDSERGFPLSWRELFTLCEFYRNKFDVNRDDFVVLLTNRKNALNWFSAYDEARNIFVHTAEWGEYSNANPHYPIAYQVVENVMQSLMKLNIATVPNPYFHEPAIGCMNDFCYDKRSIILKLQSANICSACVLKIYKEGVDEKIVKQSLEIFNGIRNELVFKIEDIPDEPEPLSILVNEKGEILLPDKGLEFRLTPLFKTLYIFYLKHKDGVRLNELVDYREELCKLYQRLSDKTTRKSREKSINALVDATGNSFSQKKSKINRTITELLGEPLARHYRIVGGRGEAFRIDLPREYCTIE